MSEQSSPFEGWAILELMGHRKLAGMLSEQEIAGGAFLRIDIPGTDGQPSATQFYAPAAVYAITPTTEEIARAVATYHQPQPVTRWELPAPTRPEAETDLREVDNDDVPFDEESEREWNS